MVKDPRLVFLRARLDELKVAATHAVEIGQIMTKHDDARMSTALTWRWELLSESVVDGRRGGGYSTMHVDGGLSPEAVLADVDSKRKLIDLAIRANEIDQTVSFEHGDEVDPSDGSWLGDEILAELLRPFAADPSFDQGWLT